MHNMYVSTGSKRITAILVRYKFITRSFLLLAEQEEHFLQPQLVYAAAESIYQRQKYFSSIEHILTP